MNCKHKSLGKVNPLSIEINCWKGSELRSCKGCANFPEPGTIARWSSSYPTPLGPKAHGTS